MCPPASAVRYCPLSAVVRWVIAWLRLTLVVTLVSFIIENETLVSRTGAERVDVSELQLPRWYGKRVNKRTQAYTHIQRSP